MSAHTARLAAVLSAVALAGAVEVCAADESGVQLAAGPMSAQVRAYCSVCHSADYIPMNAGILDRTGWEKEVRKMIKVMGAPITEDQVGPIVDYLSANYGKQ